MSDAVLTLLRWCLLGLIYLFFFRVLQATWMATTAPTKPAHARRRKRAVRAAPNPTLVVVEPVELAGTTYPIASTVTIGRAATCDITLDDTFVSQVHARIRLDEGAVVVEDLGSTNGTYLDRQRVTGAVMATPGDHVQIGGTILEVVA